MVPREKTVSDATTALSAREAVGRLLEAAQTGTVEEFEAAASKLGDGKELAEVRDANGRGALHFAARGGNLDLCKLLLDELSFPVDQRDTDGETPLIHAARLGHYDTARYLVERGADVTASSRDLGSTPLHHAAGIDSTELIRFFLDKGASVNAVSDSGTPLIWAAGHANTEAVKLLLDNHADPNILAENNVSALISGVAAGSYDIVRMLIDHGADVNVNSAGVTALHVAADVGDESIVKCLLAAGADPDALDEAGAKPIHAAASSNMRSIVQLLLPMTSKDSNDKDWSIDSVAAEKTTTSKAEPSQEVLNRALEAKARGTDAFKQRDYLTAIDAYTQAIDLDRTNATLYSNRSMCWLRTGQAEHALKDAKTAVELKPEWPKAHYREGAALRCLEKYEEAANAFYEGLMLEPDNKELKEAFKECVDTGKKHYQNKSTT